MRRIGDTVLFATLAVAILYAIVRFLPEQDVHGNGWVIDGDSLNVGGREIRLRGIDAPEALQTCTDRHGKAWPCGREATTALRRLVDDTVIECSGADFDKYDRLLARCTAGKRKLNSEMVRLGFAVSGAEQGHAYAAEEDEARAALRGIWRGAFDPPHEWRAAHE